jgi:drug/metabolite transporter (DMT)-like permease
MSFAWLVGLVSSFGPLSGVAAGVLVLGERLRRVQLVGLALLAVSLVFISLG